MRALVYPLLFFALLPTGAHASLLININTADVLLLETLPDIGPVKAQAIIDFRTASGTFATIEAVQEVRGIGPVTYEKIKPLITVTGGVSTLPPPTKPAPPPTSSNIVQKVERVTNVSPKTHDIEAVVAPTAATTVAAVGAALPSSSLFTELLTSPWTLGFIGVLIFSGVALVLL